MSCAVTADGDYYVRVSDFAHQNGGPESVYRLTVSTNPWIDAALPAVIAAGKPPQVMLFDRNLPNGQPAPGFRGREQLTVQVTPPRRFQAGCCRAWAAWTGSDTGSPARIRCSWG